MNGFLMLSLNRHDSILSGVEFTTLLCTGAIFFSGEVSIGALTRNEPSRVADPHPDMSIVDLPKKSGIFRDKDSTGCVGSMGRMGSAKNVYNVSTATLTRYGHLRNHSLSSI